MTRLRLVEQSFDFFHLGARWREVLLLVVCRAMYLADSLLMPLATTLKVARATIVSLARVGKRRDAEQ